jgi:ABC-type branched-subunit amino acid transport system ATPase component/ABC-type branched-subunit amino acid transport system permease subunit
VSRLAALLPASRGARWSWGAALLLILFAVLLPPIASVRQQIDENASATFTLFLGTEALVLALWAVSYNLMLGQTGLVSFAHAAYYGVGAYTVALLYDKAHASPLLGLLLAPLVAGAVGLVTGWIALRAVRLYFSLLTLAISQLLFVIAFQWYDVTGGDNGVHGLTNPDALSDPTAIYYCVAFVVGVCLLLIFLVIRSPFGAALAAVRENRERARSIGINVKAYELAVFTLAAAFGGVAGGLYAVYQGQAFPQMLYWTSNATPVVVTLLGGTGLFLGPALGALVYTQLSSSLSVSFPFQFDIVIGAFLLLVVLLAPGGLVSLPLLVAEVRNRLGRHREAQAWTESGGDAIRLLDVGKAVRTEALPIEATRRGEPLLTVEGLSRAFGGLRAVDEVSLTVRAGDRHAIIGPNGAGKSTLFNLITGRLPPDTGRVVFDGRDITAQPPHRIARIGIGRAFQITTIFPRLTVRQNLQYTVLAQRGAIRRPFGRADRICREEAMELVEAVGLVDQAELPAGQLSHGDQRAIELAISLALGSRLVLLDEPTAGMSAYETRKAMDLVRRIAAERGLTLLFCEHDMEVVFGTADRVTVMHRGRVLTEGAPDDVRRDPEVQKVYLGQLEEEPAGA